MNTRISKSATQPSQRTHHRPHTTVLPHILSVQRDRLREVLTAPSVETGAQLQFTRRMRSRDASRTSGTTKLISRIRPRQANTGVLQRAGAASICQSLTPAVSVPRVKQRIIGMLGGANKGRAWELGPFRCLGCSVTDAMIPITGLGAKFRQLDRNEAHERAVIKKYEQYIKAAPKGKTSADVLKKVPTGKAIGVTTLIVSWNDLMTSSGWKTLTTPNIIKTGNPFMDWATTLHENVHIAWVKKDFLAQFRQKIQDSKTWLLSSYTTPSSIKTRLRRAQSEPEIMKILVSYDRITRYELIKLYIKWYDTINEAVNYARDDQKAYCVSWQAVKQAMEFIGKCCPTSARRMCIRQPAICRPKRPNP